MPNHARSGSPQSLISFGFLAMSVIYYYNTGSMQGENLRLTWDSNYTAYHFPPSLFPDAP